MTRPTPRVKPWWFVLGATGLFALCCAGSFVITRDDRHPAKPVSAAGRIGTAVRDGGLEFTVRSVRCGLDRIGAERAQGRFCLVSLTVKNLGDRPRMLSDREQIGSGTNRMVYGAHSTADLDEINPGEEATGTIVYDLPHGVALARLELHATPASAGVIVDLR